MSSISTRALLLALFLAATACGDSSSDGAGGSGGGANNCRSGCEALLGCTTGNIDPLALASCEAECKVVQRGTCGQAAADACAACFDDFVCAASDACAAACDVDRCDGGGTGGTGGSGGSGGSPGACVEYGACATAGATCSGGLTCAETPNGTFWVTPCQATADCGSVLEVCLAEATGGERSYCWTNGCDLHSLFREREPARMNGALFEACDALVGYVDEGARTPTGTCMPLTDGAGELVAVCMASGTVEPGGSCDAAGIDLSPGATCVQGSYCTAAGQCVDLCNSGTAGLDGGSFAGCPADWICVDGGLLDQTAVPHDFGGCLEQPGGCSELGSCATVGQTCGALTCTTTPSGRRWTRGCSASADCDNITTFCHPGDEGTRPYCWLNGCDVDSVFADRNGAFFGACNTETGFDDPAVHEPLQGTCLPYDRGDGTVVGLCTVAGSAPAGASCAPDTTRQDEPWTRCEQGALCTVGGNCVTLCNSGTAGDDGARFAGCGAGAMCFDSTQGVDHTRAPYDMGQCIDTCDPFSSGSCPAVDGEAQYCQPLFLDSSDPSVDDKAGVCLPQASQTVRIGEACSPAYDGRSPNPCVDGAFCVDLYDTGTPVCEAFCDCPQGFDAQRRCRSASPQCFSWEVCGKLDPDNDRIGFCAG